MKTSKIIFISFFGVVGLFLLSLLIQVDPKKFENEKELQDLLKSLEDAKARLALTQKMEKLQQEKLAYEKERLFKGKTVTYQVLQFEIDYANAQLMRLREEARAVAEAGAQLLVLECVPSSLAAAITADLAIPTIGIGAGPGCDGQVLVLHDFLGLDTGHRRPKFVKDFLAEGGSVAGAVRAYADAVRSGAFPDDAHPY